MSRKILFFINYIPPDYGGGYLRTFRMAQRFKSNGLLHKIYTLTKSDKFVNGGVIEKTHINFLSKFLLPLEIIKNTFKERKKFDTLYVVSIHWYTLFAVLVSKLLRKKIIIGITLSGVDSPASLPTNLLLVPYYSLKNYQFKFADKIIMNSPAVHEECIKHGISPKRLRLIPNPVSIEKFNKIELNTDRQILKRKFKIHNDFPVVIFVGSVNKRKGVDLFPEILSKLSKNLTRNINFIMCGDIENDYSNQILGEVKKSCMGTPIKFKFLGSIDNINELMSITDIFILPTRNEGLPNVILEAMSSSCIIFTNLLTGITDFLLPPQSLITNNSVDQYVAKLTSAINNPSLYEKQVILNREKIVRSFSNDKVDKLFLDL